MKTKRFSLWIGCCSVVLAAALVVGNQASMPDANAQVVPPTYPGTAEQPDDLQAVEERTGPLDQPMSKSEICKASDIIGLEVRSANDENIGSIHDLALTKDGKVSYAAVSFGGFLGMGDKLFAVPFDAVEIVREGEPGDRSESFAKIDVSEQTLRNKKGFDQDNWPEKADESFLTERQVERPAASSTAPR